MTDDPIAPAARPAPGVPACDREVPVLVVGGGGCGLAASVFLSDAGVDHLLVERRESTSVLPRAHYLNQRTMEIFRQYGIADDVYRISAPLAHMSEIVWTTSLAGDGPLDARELHRMDAFGGGGTAGPYAADSPGPSTNLPQHRLEPLLRRHAERRERAELLFHHEMTEFTQDETGVTALITDRSTGRTSTVRARYLLGADGGRSIGRSLSIPMDGAGGGFTIISVHFSADLSRWWPGDSVLMTHIISPQGEVSVVVATGPEWGLASDEWALHFRVHPGAEVDLGTEAIAARVRELLKLPAELDVLVRHVSEYRPEAVVARSFQDRRVFLAGDAAHRQPPAAGGGLNTAVQDAHNIAWKLGAVVSGRAEPALLDTYEAERLPVATRNVRWAMACLRNYGVLFASLGMVPGQPEATLAGFGELLSDSPMGETRRTVTREVFATQRIEYQAHDIELGHSYPSGAVVPDGTPPPPRDPLGAVHHPVTRPGHRLPHAWLRHGDTRVSTLDLVGRHAGFVLITGPLSEVWEVAAKKAADTYGVAVTVVSVGNAPGTADHWDDEGTWAAVRGTEDDGALLVRPDQHVAWRAERPGPQPDRDLGGALRRVLGHPDATAAGG
ncbi:FAD-dependent monooxygenase [Streptomyces zingiberis]|uniref:Aromatic ring hydroxylase n=1 Tax=Streptomyces zingiberis TaxID=2053010 RepID=A0ABX1BXY2_9ACTN|nr:FAD-dependent monooxygenase [Streptomyces zingiberis]NJQ02551.1 aromatic ring hydroxylase [Streptomyces zingiberis]